MQDIRNALRATAMAVAAVVLVSCASDTTGIGAGSSQIAFMSKQAASAGASASTVPVTSGGHTLDLTQATLTLARIELKRTHSDACTGDEDNDDDHPTATPSTASCGELKVGPTSVNLPLTGGMASISANTIPPGTYRELELRVTQIELKGTFDGKAFDVTVPVHVEDEVEFSTPLVVTEGQPVTLTVNVSTDTWLRNADGSLVDPNQLATSPLLAAQVRTRILASFHAFEDRDRDGRDDHGGDHGG
jgi:hypothetical protein